MELAIRLNSKCDLYYGVMHKKLDIYSTYKHNRFRIKCSNAFKVVEFLLFGHKSEIPITQAMIDDPAWDKYIKPEQIQNIVQNVDIEAREAAMLRDDFHIER